METILQVGARADVRQAATGGQVGAVARSHAERGARERGEAGIDGPAMGAGAMRGADASPSNDKFQRTNDKGISKGQSTNSRLPIVDLNGRAASGPGVGVTILVPRMGKPERWDEWMWRELREGGRLKGYLELEKRMAEARLREVARRMDGFEQNNKSEWRLKAAVPMREYMRWKKEDAHFWEDDSNLKSWKRDNPDAVVKV